MRICFTRDLIKFKI